MTLGWQPYTMGKLTPHEIEQGRTYLRELKKAAKATTTPRARGSR